MDCDVTYQHPLMSSQTIYVFVTVLYWCLTWPIECWWHDKCYPINQTYAVDLLTGRVLTDVFIALGHQTWRHGSIIPFHQILWNTQMYTNPFNCCFAMHNFFSLFFPNVALFIGHLSNVKLPVFCLLIYRTWAGFVHFQQNKIPGHFQDNSRTCFQIFQDIFFLKECRCKWKHTRFLLFCIGHIERLISLFWRK